MKFEVMTITPEMAQEMLEHNIPNNRKMNRATITARALDMKLGNWKLTHQPIAFASNGDLIDGQNRLTAIVKAGVAVKMAVAWYESEDDNALMVIDIGTVRNPRMIAKISGEGDMVSDMMPVAHALMRGLGTDANRITPERKIRFINDNRNIFSKMYDAADRKIKGVHASIMATLLLALANYVPEDGIRKFIGVWRENDVQGMSEYNVKPVLQLKQRVKGTVYSPTVDNMKNVQGVFHAYIANTRTVTPKFWYPAYGRLNMDAIDETRSDTAEERGR